jgi:uncharacterized membrane protein YhaH (DUF805 family)
VLDFPRIASQICALLMVLTVAPGDTGANRFGADPRDVDRRHPTDGR